MKIQQANPTHINQLASLYQEAMTLLAQSDQRLSAQVNKPMDWRAIMDDAQSALFIGEAEAAVIGFIHGQIKAENGLMLSLVLDAHRYHGGIGRQLWQTLRTWFEEQGVTHIYLCVPRYQAVTQAFWRSLGAKTLETAHYPESIESPAAGMTWMTF